VKVLENKFSVYVSVKYARFISWDHILDVDESIFSSVHLEELKGLLDKISQVEALSLTVVNLVSNVGILDLEEVHDGQDLSVVRHKGLTNGLRAGHESLQDLEGDGDDVNISGVQGSLDWDNELRNDGQNLGATSFKHVKDTLDSKESVGVHLFSDTLPRRR
jgi:hypothetical protein